MNEDKNTQVISEVLSKGYFAIVREKWQKTRGKSMKFRLRFVVGLMGFTLGFILLRSAIAVHETMLDIQAWLQSRKKEKEDEAEA